MKATIVGLSSNEIGDAGQPYWTENDLDAMDRAFCKRMLDAIDAGLELCPKRVSTRPFVDNGRSKAPRPLHVLFDWPMTTTFQRVHSLSAAPRSGRNFPYR